MKRFMATFGLKQLTRETMKTKLQLEFTNSYIYWKSTYTIYPKLHFRLGTVMDGIYVASIPGCCYWPGKSSEAQY